MPFWPFGRTYKVKCPDGSIKTVYRKVDHAFPLFIPGWKGDVSAEVKAFEQLPAQAKAAYESKVQGLLYALNERNQSLMIEFRSIYVAFHTDPCGMADFFRRELQKLLEEQRQLSVLTTKIQGLIEVLKVGVTPNEQIWSLFGDIVQSLGAPAIPETAVVQIEQSRELMQRWIQSHENDR